MALALSQVPQIPDPRVLVGNNTADDAGIFRLSKRRALVHTVDMLAPMVDDPYTYGRIAAVNSLSDVYAMGGEPLAALNVLGAPSGTDPETIAAILRGAQDAVVDAGAAVVGGHTFQDAEFRFGLALTGIIDPSHIYANNTARPGDALVLTKPLGVGTVTQAMMVRGAVPTRMVDLAVQTMTTSNRTAAEIMKRCHATACTDVTGFGFIGHALEMLDEGMSLEIDAGSIPIIDGVLELIREGVINAGCKMNRNSFENAVNFGSAVDNVMQTLLFESETSGGLLIAISQRNAKRLLDELHSAKLQFAQPIGKFVKKPGKTLDIG